MLEFVVYDKNDVFRQVAVPQDSHVELLWNRVSFAELTFDDDDRVWESLQLGARVAVLWDGVERMRGPVVGRDGAGPEGQITATVEDDSRMFRGLGWPKPAAAITAQTDEYRRYTGPTESVVKSAFSELSTRLGLGWTIPASTGLGSDQRVEFRFHPLIDKLGPLLDADLLTLRISNGLVTVAEGNLFPRVLTTESGVLGNYKWTEKFPEATRVVVGGGGQDVDRVFRAYVDSARETAYGAIVEVFKDSRMAEGITDLSPDADEVLAEGAPKVSVTADLNESAWFRFGIYDIGDRVQISVGPVETTEVIRSVVIAETVDQGVTVTPHIGSLEDNADSMLGLAVARLGRGVRDSEKR